MKICATCREELPRESFSRKQWLLKQHQRRCKICIEANREVQLKRQPKNDGDAAAAKAPSSGASCLICLDDELDEFAQPPTRDCSCRGTDAGFAHFSCIVKYAQHENMQLDDNWDYIRDIVAFRKPWKECPNCHQYYQNDLASNLAHEFVTFVKRSYPGDELKLIESSYLKLSCLARIAQNQLLQPKQREDAKRVGYRIISMIRRMEETDSPLLENRILYIKALAYNKLGQIVQSEGTKEAAKLALAYFGKYRDTSKANSLDSDVQTAETNIAIISSRLNINGDGEEQMLKNCKKTYEESVKKYGKESDVAIADGKNLAVALYNAKHALEAERLLVESYVIAKRVHGTDHSDTQKIESILQVVKRRTVEAEAEGEWKSFQALRFEEDGNACITQGPIAEPRCVHEEKQYTFSINDVIITPRNPVICQGLEENLAYLNGKIGDLRFYDDEEDSYEVNFEDEDLQPCLVKRAHVHMLFDLPTKA